MAQVRIEQRNGRLATDVRLESVETREGALAKATVVVISNGFRGGESEPTAVRWTVWGKQAENARKYLSKGSRVNVVGTLKNNNYDKGGETVYGFDFTAEEIDYLESRGPVAAPTAESPSAGMTPAAAGATTRKGKGARSAPAANSAIRSVAEDDIPF